MERFLENRLRAVRFWLGMRDSNPRMAESKSAALPLGESPMWDFFEKARAFYGKGAPCQIKKTSRFARSQAGPEKKGEKRDLTILTKE